MILTSFGTFGTENIDDDSYCGCKDLDFNLSTTLCDPPNINDTYYLGINESYFVDGPVDPCKPRFNPEEATRFDWRDPDHNPTGRDCVTPVRDQAACGSCWAFATTAPIESKIMIQHGYEFDISERWLVSKCCSAGDCNGGWWAFSWYKQDKSPCNDFGIVPEDELPYPPEGDSYGGPCDNCNDLSFLYKIDKWAYVKEKHGVAPTDRIKQAIMDHGPVAAAVHVDLGWQFYYLPTAYSGFKGRPNHGVTIVGWDDNVGPHGSWIIKNSWGSLWGCRAGYGTERGYMYIQYGANNIGYASAYVGNVLPKNPHTSGKPKIVIDLDKVGDIDPIEGVGCGDPEWYYVLTVTEEDGDIHTIKQENKFLDEDNAYKWDQAHEWDLSADLNEDNTKRHRYFLEVDSKTVEISVKLMEADEWVRIGPIWVGWDDLADVSPVPDPDYNINPLTGLGDYDDVNFLNIGSRSIEELEDKTVFKITYNVCEQSFIAPKTDGSADGSTDVDENDAYIYFNEISDNYDLPVAEINGTPSKAILNLNRTFKADLTNGSHGPFEYQWDFSYDENEGFNIEATGKKVSKKWTSIGSYTVALKVKDNVGWYSKDLVTTDIKVEENQPPDVPSVTVPSEEKVKPGKYDFTFISIDPNEEGDKVYYRYKLLIEKKIGKNETVKTSDWFGPYEPNTEQTIKINLAEKNTDYIVRAQSKDLSGAESDWSLGYEQPTPKSKDKNIVLEPIFRNLLKLFFSDCSIFGYLKINL